MIESNFKGDTLSWQVAEGVLELTLHREPCNQIGSATLEDLERFTEALEAAGDAAHVIILHSTLKCGFSAGADLRELFHHSQQVAETERLSGIRDFLERIHRVMNALDGGPLPVIAAVHGVCFGGGFELALTADLIIADRTARFCFPELRLGLIPGFGGVPRLKRDLGNAVVRDLLLTGRSINATKAQAVGLVSQVVAEGQAQFLKPIPHEDLCRETDIFCALFTRPAVQEALRKFVESKDALPYLP
jgi:enoyl-CoA hydratase/carnithine racemase